VKCPTKLKSLSITLENGLHRISTDGLNSFMDNLRQCSKIKYFGINFSHSANYIGDKGMEALSRGFTNWRKLRSLNLTGVNNPKDHLTDLSLRTLSQGLLQAKNLQSLKLIVGDNLNIEFTDKGFQELFSALGKTPSLSSLQLSFHSIKLEFSNDNLIHLGNSIQQLPILEEFKFSIFKNKSKVDSQGLMKFGSRLRKFRNLRFFSFQIDNYGGIIEVPSIENLLNNLLVTRSISYIQLTFFGRHNETHTVRAKLDKLIDRATRYIKWDFNYEV